MKSAEWLSRMAFCIASVTFQVAEELEVKPLPMVTESSNEERSEPFAPTVPHVLVPSYVAHVAPSSVQLCWVLSQAPTTGEPNGKSLR